MINYLNISESFKRMVHENWMNPFFNESGTVSKTFNSGGDTVNFYRLTKVYSVNFLPEFDRDKLGNAHEGRVRFILANVRSQQPVKLKGCKTDSTQTPVRYMTPVTCSLFLTAPKESFSIQIPPYTNSDTKEVSSLTMTEIWDQLSISLGESVAPLRDIGIKSPSIPPLPEEISSDIMHIFTGEFICTIEYDKVKAD